MPRPKQINYKRVTFSFPSRVVVMLREKVGQNNMSSYVAGLVKKDLNKRSREAEKIIQELDEFRKNHPSKIKQSSLETLREIRYGNKYS